MPCEVNPCRLCQQTAPQPGIRIKSTTTGQEMQSIRPGCHPEAELGPFVPVQQNQITPDGEQPKIDVKV